MCRAFSPRFFAVCYLGLRPRLICVAPMALFEVWCGLMLVCGAELRLFVPQVCVRLSAGLVGVGAESQLLVEDVSGLQPSVFRGLLPGASPQANMCRADGAFRSLVRAYARLRRRIAFVCVVGLCSFECWAGWSRSGITVIGGGMCRAFSPRFLPFVTWGFAPGQYGSRR
jgi:hypothetical protein